MLQNEFVAPVEITVKEDVPVRSYFKWIDSLVAEQNQKINYTIDEYLIVHFNKWIIDTLPIQITTIYWTKGFSVKIRNH